MPELDRLTARMRPYETSIFGEMSALAATVGAVNLGQGFPDTDGPDELKQIAIQAIADGSGNQYPPVHGLPILREAIAEHQLHHYGIALDPLTQVVVTTGASEALAAAVIALTNPGEDVIVFEPYFDLYASVIAMAGANRIAVPMRGPEPGTQGCFRLDVAALQAAISAKTTVMILNSPHNPTGMVLTDSELVEVTRIAQDHNLIVISDEAYEHLVYAPHRHTPIATLPGMFDRTITVGSGGKSFSFTGWKVGWATGPTDLVAAVKVVRQHLSYVSGGPFQPAIAAGLRLPDSYFRDFANSLAARRDLLTEGLRSIGHDVLETEGTYFVISDIRPTGISDAREYCRDLPERVGVAAIPVAALADDQAQFSPYVRWTFCKQPAVLNEAIERLSSAV